MAEQGSGRPDRLLAALEDRIDHRARPWLGAALVGATPMLQARLPGVFRACFTTRHGGESTGAFSSLNLDLRSEDDPVTVARNRERVRAPIDRRLVSPAQAHGLRVAGAAEYVQAPPDTPCDGLTLHPELDRGMAALLVFADCVPVVLCSEVDMGVAHGGWRGILGGIVHQAGRAMIGPPATAVIGPSIGPCCFTVDEEVAAAFAARFGQEVVCDGAAAVGRASGTARRVDLWAAVTRSLEELGVPRAQVVNPRLCTVCNHDLFFSYRKEGPVTGRHGCLAWMAES